MYSHGEQDVMWKSVTDSIGELLILLDSDLRITYMNEIAQRHLTVNSNEYIGKRLEDIGVERFDREQLYEIMRIRTPLKDYLHKTHGNKHFSTSIAPLIAGGRCVGLSIIALNVTDYVEMEHELDMAFSLCLPDTKVEFKLRSTLEYKDTYDPVSKTITITDIIPDGGYRHVVNCLRIFSVLRQKGVTKIIGIDKNILVPALIMHDVGKSQPILAIGDVVDPKEVFEISNEHAVRSADIAKEYGFNDDVVTMIRYHHTTEEELPEEFSRRLRPALRLFKLIDGLSASITRCGAEIAIAVFDCIVQVTEKNTRPEYNGIWQYDLYTGMKRRIAVDSSIHELSAPIIGQVSRYR